MDVRDVPTIVTGAASGLGRASAQALAQAGARVTLVDRNTEGVTAAAADIGGLGISWDVADGASAVAAVAQAAAAHGPARILVNCAGVAPAARSSAGKARLRSRFSCVSSASIWSAPST